MAYQLDLEGRVFSRISVTRLPGAERRAWLPSDVARRYRDEDMVLARRFKYAKWQVWVSRIVMQAREWNRQAIIARRCERLTTKISLSDTYGKFGQKESRT